MEKEISIALNLIQAYEASRKHGVLVLRGFDFECDELEFMTSIVFDCLSKNINIDQMYEILNNYRDDFDNKKVHKLIVNGLMCMIGGDNIEYLKELLSSILGRSKREEFLKYADKIAVPEHINDIVIKKYLNKKPFSQNTELPDDIFDNAENLKSALNKMSNMEVCYILAGVSGKNAVKIFHAIDPDIIKLIDEDYTEQIDEQDIINAKNKLVDAINRASNCS